MTIHRMTPQKFWFRIWNHPLDAVGRFGRWLTSKAEGWNLANANRSLKSQGYFD